MMMQRTYVYFTVDIGLNQFHQTSTSRKIALLPQLSAVHCPHYKTFDISFIRTKKKKKVNTQHVRKQRVLFLKIVTTHLARQSTIGGWKTAGLVSLAALITSCCKYSLSLVDCVAVHASATSNEPADVPKRSINIINDAWICQLVMSTWNPRNFYRGREFYWDKWCGKKTIYSEFIFRIYLVLFHDGN